MYLDSQIIDINGSFWIEVVAFLIMLAVLARYAYPRIISAAEARQRQIAEQLEGAERARQAAELRLTEAESRLDEARKQAQEVIASAGKSAEQLRQELRQKAEEDARRISESARSEIETERRKALESVRGSIAALVVAATEKVIGGALDTSRHHQLIEEAIETVGGAGDGQRQR